MNTQNYIKTLYLECCVKSILEYKYVEKCTGIKVLVGLLRTREYLDSRRRLSAVKHQHNDKLCKARIDLFFQAYIYITQWHITKLYIGI